MQVSGVLVDTFAMDLVRLYILLGSLHGLYVIQPVVRGVKADGRMVMGRMAGGGLVLQRSSCKPAGNDRRNVAIARRRRLQLTTRPGTYYTTLINSSASSAESILLYSLLLKKWRVLNARLVLSIGFVTGANMTGWSDEGQGPVPSLGMLCPSSRPKQGSTLVALGHDRAAVYRSHR